MLSQPPLTMVSELGQATEATACECPLSCCLEASAAGAEGTAAPTEPFFFLALVSCFAAADVLSRVLSATADPAARHTKNSVRQTWNFPGQAKPGPIGKHAREIYGC